MVNPQIHRHVNIFCDVRRHCYGFPVLCRKRFGDRPVTVALHAVGIRNLISCRGVHHKRNTSEIVCRIGLRKCLTQAVQSYLRIGERLAGRAVIDGEAERGVLNLEFIVYNSHYIIERRKIFRGQVLIHRCLEEAAGVDTVYNRLTAFNSSLLQSGRAVGNIRIAPVLLKLIQSLRLRVAGAGRVIPRLIRSRSLSFIPRHYREGVVCYIV